MLFFRGMHTLQRYRQFFFYTQRYRLQVHWRRCALQRSWARVGWLREGDQNTRYFQNRASHRKRKNTVRGLRRDDGSKCTVDEEMRSMAARYYANLFCSEGSANADRVIGLMDEVI